MHRNPPQPGEGRLSPVELSEPEYAAVAALCSRRGLTVAGFIRNATLAKASKSDPGIATVEAFAARGVSVAPIARPQLLAVA